MKNLFYICFSFCFVLSTNAQNGKIKAYIEQKSFFSPEVGNYVELYFQFVGYTLKYEALENGLIGRVMLSTSIINFSGDTIKKERYVLESPLMRDSIIEDFYDAQRFALPNGTYSAFIELLDLNVKGSEAMSGIIPFKVIESKDPISISDITIAELAVPSSSNTPFVKSGYEIIPRLSNFYGKDQNTLPYYTEIYSKSYLLDTMIGVKQTIISNDNQQEVMGFTRFTRMKVDQVIPVLRKIDMSSLYTGSYTLKIEVIDRNNVVLGVPSTYSFERINEKEFTEDITEVVLDPSFQASFTNDSLRFYLESILPIAKQSQIKMILETAKSEDNEQKRKILQQFWVATSGNKATQKWLEYKEQVLFAQKLYSTNILEGFETDRGRVYLQYGPPNSIINREISSSEYPYEIWVYDKIQTFSNKRFIFYNPDLVNNNFTLLHSDMRGELQNLRWQQALTKRNNPNQNPNNPVDDEYFGGNSDYYYRRF